MSKVMINPESKTVVGVTTKREMRAQFIELKEFLARLER